MAEQRLIDANEAKKSLLSYYSFVNENTSKSNYTGETLMSYEVADMIEDCIDNAPTIDPETMPIVRQLREELKNEIAKKQICGEVIERLDKQLEKVTAERDEYKESFFAYKYVCGEIPQDRFEYGKRLDAAMSFIPKTCATCKYGKSPCDWCTTDPDGDLNWEWNGKRKEE